MNKIELLAPAKDLECGAAAINCGADAVYIGAPKFGARENVGNSFEDIAALVNHAHKYWARVYVTLNTLLTDPEIPQALRMVSKLHEIGIDGLIIQDAGLLECDLPPIPLIASTQMHNNTPGKVEFLEKVGFQRVILARELDIDQIKEIRQRTKIELECFIHGALCVCYSGQCYMSYALGGRSGNRGQCAQPCRRPYTLADASGKPVKRNSHLLSLKDLNLSDCITDLLEAGVSSFKIEGRLKDKTYVTNVVSHYRAKLNEAMGDMGFAKSSSGRSIILFNPDPDKTFNRGYSTYFLYGKGGRIGSIDSPKMIGEPVGKVISASKLGVTLDTRISLHRGDGICFFDRDGELRGTVVNEVKGRTITPAKLECFARDVMVYRNHDHEFITNLKNSEPRRVMGVEFALSDTQNGLTLTAIDEDGNSARYSVECEKTPAEKPDTARVNIEKQLSKVGGTDFECSGVKIELADMLFIPISILNSLRRGALDELEKARIANRPVGEGKAIKNDIPYPETRLTYMGNVLNSKAEAFYKRHGVTEIEPAAESGLDMRKRKLMTTRYCIKHQLGICKDPKYKGPMMLIDDEGNKFTLKFDCEKCEMGIWLR